VQPLVREAAARGASVNELTSALRAAHGHAYRRSDMLEDLRRYRTAVAIGELIDSAPQVVGVSAATEILSAAVAVGQAMPRYLDFRRTIARAGVAVFAVALLLPTVLFGATRTSGNVLVADANQLRVAAGRAELSLPNQVAVRPRSVVTPEPTATPTPPPTPTPTPAPTPRPVAMAAAAVPSGPGVLVTASWYGPGFFENRLPCWQWLQANGLPIQFLPDTWGVAHKTLPCGTMLVLTHGPNTITVPVVDRGPYIAGRELDLSPRIKAALGCTDLCTVLMQIK
jgi:hypothetical protein